MASCPLRRAGALSQQNVASRGVLPWPVPFDAGIGGLLDAMLQGRPPATWVWLAVVLGAAGSIPVVSSSGADSGDGDTGRPATHSGVKSIDRAVAILNVFTREHAELTLSEIARRSGLTTSTAYRLLSALQAHGLVEQVANKRYALGPHVRRLAHMATARPALREAAAPVMRWLRDITGETVGLHVLTSGPRRLVIDQVESRHDLRRIYTGLGEPIPVHEGAPGKVLLAYLPLQERESVLAHKLEAATAQTIVEPGALRREIDRVRERGYATSIEERVPGIRTLAVPVWDHTNVVIASLSVTGPGLRLTRERLRDLLRPAVRAGHELSAQLGFVTGANVDGHVGHGWSSEDVGDLSVPRP